MAPTSRISLSNSHCIRSFAGSVIHFTLTASAYLEVRTLLRSAWSVVKAKRTYAFGRIGSTAQWSSAHKPRFLELIDRLHTRGGIPLSAPAVKEPRKISRTQAAPTCGKLRVNLTNHAKLTPIRPPLERAFALLRFNAYKERII